MIGTKLVEELVQSVALSHLVKGHRRVSILLMASPESGKTTITSAANCDHVCRVAVVTGRSIIRECNEHPNTEFLLFNDLTSIRAMCASAVNLLINVLNQVTQNERGMIAFAAQQPEYIKREVGLIACLPFKTFEDHRSRWREMGFVSRMIPFSYSYSNELVAEIKDSIDEGNHAIKVQPFRKMPKSKRRQITVTMNHQLTKQVRRIADNRAAELKQIGIRLLMNYHCLVRAHALLHKRTAVTNDDVKFLRAVDSFVSVTKCNPLNGDDKD